ncbi:hypothetical protein C8R42DRAFT_647546 [Lentinula raphanica]|nr:hypothetical protein C8R42DRAFT_647546 [Lentinula raphanica]
MPKECRIVSEEDHVKVPVNGMSMRRRNEIEDQPKRGRRAGTAKNRRAEEDVALDENQCRSVLLPHCYTGLLVSINELKMFQDDTHRQCYRRSTIMDDGDESDSWPSQSTASSEEESGSELEEHMDSNEVKVSMDNELTVRTKAEDNWDF